jgi:LmbE family N-acetylglucosaminyl deacetylase
MNRFERPLILAPHADDGEFGSGATVARLLEIGADVHYAAFSMAVKSLPPGFPEDTLRGELDAATRSLGIKPSHVHVFDFEVRTFPTHRQEILEILIQLRDEVDPDLVLLPSLHDIHQDHSTVAGEGLRAFKRTTIMGYELPWNNYSFDHQVYVPVKERHVASKVAALRCYESQQHRNYANEEYIWSLARTRGIDVNCPFAEVFELYRWIWK